jgi:simple sugar transport system substrate-binding protein
MGESGGASLGAVKAVRNQNQVGKIAVFGSDMTTEIAQELENYQVLKAVVDISGKKMGDAVFTQTMNVINKQPPAEKVIQVPIDLYAKREDGKQWLATHVDGLP